MPLLPGQPSGGALFVPPNPDLTLRGQAATDPAQVAKLAQLAGVFTGLEQTITAAEGQAAAQNVAVEGARSETQAYENVNAIGAENARVARIAGDIATYQQQLKVSGAIGSARAAYGAAGFNATSNASDLLRSSLQQGALGEQLIQVQAQLTAGGFEEEAAAATAEAAAGRAQIASGQALASAYSTQSAEASTELQQLENLYQTTPAQVTQRAKELAAAAPLNPIGVP